MRTLSPAFIIAALFLVRTAATHHHQGCLLVEKFPTLPESSCDVCYRRKPKVPKPVGCGPLVGDQDKCMFYEHFRAAKRTVCGHCLENYALDSRTYTCVVGKVQGCVSEFINPDGRRRCYACKNGYSIQFHDGTSKCLLPSEVEHPIANCLWGGPYVKEPFQAATINCYRCQPGYTVDFFSLKCEKAKFPGCMRSSQDGTRCQECNVFDGFSQQPDYSCLKVD